MKFLFALFFLFSCLAVQGQTVRLDMTESIDSSGLTTITVPSTKFFESYYNCSMDSGFRLKSKLPDGTYEVYINDTLSYRAHFLKRKRTGKWEYFYSVGEIRMEIFYEKGESKKWILYDPEGEITEEGPRT